MSKKTRKPTKQTQVHPWFPKCVDNELIPAIRSLGRGGISAIDAGPTPLGRSVNLKFGKTPETPQEYRANKSIDGTLLVGLAAVLAEGPKLFVIPTDMIEHLNQIEIPIKVSDYEQPFPAVVVKNGSEYHIVFQLDEYLFCATVMNGFVDSCCFLNTEETIESYLSASHSSQSVQIDRNTFAEVLLEQNVNDEHRFRATLNFLLMIMAGGFVQVRQTGTRNKKRRSEESASSKYTTPQSFEPQDIALWRTRLATANQRTESLESTGGKKRTHWRRAHWRRVAVGAGRTGRDFRLIPACLVNKNFLSGSASDSEYTVS